MDLHPLCDGPHAERAIVAVKRVLVLSASAVARREFRQPSPSGDSHLHRGYRPNEVENTLS